MRASTKALIAKHGWRFDRAIPNYIYFIFYYPYVRFVYYLFKYLSKYLSWFKPLKPIVSMALNRYHAKILSGGDVKKMVTLNEDILRHAVISHAGKGFFCDASVMPSALGLPIIWTVVALGKRLGKHLNAQIG